MILFYANTSFGKLNMLNQVNAQKDFAGIRV
jgi:hypothetical protein